MPLSPLLEDLVVEHRGSQVDGEGSGLLLDIGTGTGRILELLADRFERCIGIDLSANMLHAARGKLSGSDVANWQVRQGNVYALDIGDNKADVAVLHHVLHFLDDPSAALKQVSFALDTDGLVIVADFSPHTVNELRTEFGHRWLGFSTAKVTEWFTDADLDLVETHELVVDQELPVETLTVTIWVARKTQ